MNERTEPKQMDGAVAEPPQSARKMLLMIYSLQSDQIKVAGSPSGSPANAGEFHGESAGARLLVQARVTQIAEIGVGSLWDDERKRP